MEQLEIVTKIALDGWRGQIAATDKLLNSLTGEDLMLEIAPGKNRGIYLLGHLTAVHDRMMPLLGFGAQKYAKLDGPFLMSPDNIDAEMPTVAELRTYWTDANRSLDERLADLQPAEWLQKHTSVSEEDFAKEPHRNRLNVVTGRTFHLANHLGQLLLLKK